MQLRGALNTVDLQEDGEHIRKMWGGSEEPHVPLPLAAALAFHEACGGMVSVMPRPEYEDALDLVAAALSRLLPIYKVDEATRTHVAVKFNLGGGKFRQGATVYEPRNGNAVSCLTVRRVHVPAAMEMIKAVGIPFQIGGGAS